MRRRTARSPKPRPTIFIVVPTVITVLAFLAEQIATMQQAGFDVTVVCSPASQPGLIQELSLLCTPVFIPTFIPRSGGPFAALRALFRLVKLFRQHQPDIIHTHVPMAAFLGQTAGWLCRVPCRITTVHGLYFVNTHKRPLRSLYRLLEVTACRLAHHIICVSAEDTQLLIERHGIPAAKIETMHAGVNLSQYDPQRFGLADRVAIRKELNIPDNAVVFGAVARMVREKGLVELFNAFDQLSKDYENVYLLHVGSEDRDRSDCLSQAELIELSRSGRCRFAGQRSDVQRYLAAADIFCLPSHREGFPVSVMEASAMGLPSIVTDIRGCREAVIDGETGLIVGKSDVASLERAMRRFLDFPLERQRMGDNALRHARGRFDRRDVVTRTLQLYFEFLEIPALPHRDETAPASISGNCADVETKPH